MTNQTQNKASQSSQATRLLDPTIMAGLGNLELIARTIVRGVVIGLHRTNDFGFSQEFAEYRQYEEGDDTRLIDWNVYARNDRMVIKRFRGETNSQLMILLDTSASMGFKSDSRGITKLDYGKMLAASLAYLTAKQKDSMGLMLFDEEVRDYRAPSSRAGQLPAIMHLLESAQAQNPTELEKPFAQSMSLGHKRGMVAVISDFYTDTQALLEAIRPMSMAGQDILLFQVMDDGELKPDYQQSVLLEDAESGAVVEVSPDYMRDEYPQKIATHNAGVELMAKKAGCDYFLLTSKEPLDRSLHRYLSFRQRRA